MLFNNTSQFTELNVLVAITNTIASVFSSFKMVYMELIFSPQPASGHVKSFREPNEKNISFHTIGTITLPIFLLRT